MIKKSLHDLRQKLDVMRKDKEAVENGILEYETKNNYNWIQRSERERETYFKELWTVDNLMTNKLIFIINNNYISRNEVKSYFQSLSETPYHEHQRTLIIISTS